ncbi:MAG: winged helix-turn-helix domain-containing protein [Gammaproteobacteria bacterium]
MNDAGTDQGLIRFSGFTLDLRRNVLLQGDRRVALRPKSFDVLHYLVRHAGEVVSPEALLDAVWGDTVVTEDSVRQCIADVRKALGDGAHKIVRTLPRRGYILDLERDQEGARDATHGNSESGIPWRAAASLAMLLVIVAIFRYLGGSASDPEPVPAQSPPQNSIAVLRFADMTPAGDHAYLAEGIAEEILHRLAQSPTLRVIARTSSFAVEGNTIASVARQLNVAHVLEGSVRRSGDRIRIAVQLVDGATSEHVWSETYDADFGDILEIQARIAEAVAERLDGSLAGRDGVVHAPSRSTRSTRRPGSVSLRSPMYACVTGSRAKKIPGAVPGCERSRDTRSNKHCDSARTRPIHR